MANSLHTLFQAIATARDERELRVRFMDTVGEHFGVQHWGIHLLDDQSRMVTVDIYGKSDKPLLKSNDVFTKESAVEVSESLAIQRRPDLSAFLEYCEKTGRDIDPVVRYVIERHAPAHEAMVLPTESWKQCELYQQRYASYGYKHIMMGPIVGGGQLIGTVHFARSGDAPAFSAGDLADLSAICAHLSTCLAVLRSQPTRFDCLLTNRLTERELQIAELVAQGLTNAEIGEKLWITQNSVKQALKRMFRKLKVSARTEMVAKLRDVLVS
jgi:DNA-binding CsgD family transcriptional regulator/GAF domain-containing protein